MRIDQLKPSVIVRGPIFPEPVQVIVLIPMGQSIKLVGKGLNTVQVHEPILNAEQVATLEAAPENAPFDGDPQRFRLGREYLFSYFNLCAEEYFFYKAGYFDRRVWKSWYRGMKVFFKHPRIQALWEQDCKADSYYGFRPPQ